MSDIPARVVIVEDETQIRRFVRQALEDEGCHVYEAATAAQGLIEAATRRPDLVILDLGLPDRDGAEVIRDLRTWSNIPIIILSARSHEDDKIRALDAGADDYLAKPFGVGELLARTRAMLRRKWRAGEEMAPTVAFCDIRVDLSRRTVHRNADPVHLTALEYRLLSVLVANAGCVLTHRQLLKEVWGTSFVESSHYLRIYVRHLRQKLEQDPTQPRHILTETGVGYRFQP